MQPWILRHPLAFVVADFLLISLIWLLGSFVVSYIGGWFSLARKFRSRAPFTGSKWGGESGMMRGFGHYRNCLVIGASPTGLYLAVFFLFRVAHPPLLIPWNEVTLSRGRKFFMNMVRFQLGRENPIPLSIRESLVGKLKAAAGNAWPIESLG
jgi:hypothetical protein